MALNFLYYSVCKSGVCVSRRARGVSRCARTPADLYDPYRDIDLGAIGRHCVKQSVLFKLRMHTLYDMYVCPIQADADRHADRQP